MPYECEDNQDVYNDYMSKIHFTFTSLLFSIDFSTVPAYDAGGTGDNKLVIHWDNLSPCDINHYSDYTDIELSKIIVPQGIKCNDPNCLNHSHRDEIDELYASIVSTIKKCSHAFVSTGKHTVKEFIVPGWNEQVQELHDAVRNAYLTWREIGKPRQGDVFIMMKLSRRKFKYALRKCKRDYNCRQHCRKTVSKRQP